MSLEDVLPVSISLEPPCKGCQLGFDREEYEGKFWHVWEGRAYLARTEAPVSKSTISTFQLFEMFPTAESARLYLESRLWPDGPFCPECKSRERIGKQPKVGFYRCNACSLDFTIRTGTIFERSHIPLHKWLYAMYLLVTARKGISSLQLGKEIGVTQKSAWFMLQRLREACGSGDESISPTRN